MRLRQVGLNSLEAFANHGLLEGSSTCKLKIGRHDVLDNKTKVKFGTLTHCSEGLLIIFTLMFGVLPKSHLGVNNTLSGIPYETEI